MNQISSEKIALYDLCADFIETKRQTIQHTIVEIQHSLTSETKSSAGDKHETGRAMLQLEREKIGNQLAEIDKQIEGYKAETEKLTVNIQNINNEIEGLEFVVPRHQGSALTVHNFKTGNFGVFGDYPELDIVQKKDMVYGRFINDNDIKERKKVCVIEEEIYKQAIGYWKW